MKVLRTVAGLATLCVLGGAIVWRLSEKKAVAKDLQQAQAKRKGTAPGVVVAVAGPKRLAQSLEVVGSVESPATAKLSAKASGRLASVLVREGAVVRAGDTLVTLDPADLTAAVVQQEAAVAEARARLAQARSTEDVTRVGVQSGLATQRAVVQSAATDVAQAVRTLSSTVATGQAQIADSRSKVAAADFAVANAQADLGTARANLENARTKLTRSQNLLQQGFVSAQSVDDARTTEQVSEGAVASAQGKVSAAKAARDSAAAQLAAVQSQSALAGKKAQADIDAARSKQKQALAALAVASSNRSQTDAYRQNLAALAQSVGAADALLAQARVRLADTAIKTPIAGVITARAFDPGTVVTAGQPILTVQSLSWVYVTASVPVEQSGRVGIGTRAQVTFDGAAGKPIATTVAEVNPAADPQTRRYTIRMRLDNSSGRLRPGMFARIALETRVHAAAVAVPSDAVKPDKDGSVVTVVADDGAAQVRPVKVGESAGADVEILSGVAAGEKVVTLAYQPVKDGQTVTVGEKPEKGADRSDKPKAVGAGEGPAR